MLKLVDGVVGAGGVSVAGLVVQESVSEQEDAITQSLLMEGSLVGVKVRNSNSVTYTGFTFFCLLFIFSYSILLGVLMGEISGHSSVKMNSL